MPEEEGTEGLLQVRETQEEEVGPKEVVEKQEETKITNQEEELDDRNNLKEVEAAEEGGTDDIREDGVSLGEEPVEDPAVLRGEREEELKDDDEECDEDKESEGTDKGTDERAEHQEVDQEKSKEEVSDYLSKVTKLEETPGPEGNLQPTASLSATRGAEPQPDNQDEAVKTEGKDAAKTSSPPKVLSAVARFQSQAHGQGLPVKTRAKELAGSNVFWSREKAQVSDSNKADSDDRSEERDEEVLPVIKVSELKKRFEA